MSDKPSIPWKQVVQNGLLGGCIALLLALIGMVESFSKRDIISGILSMGQVLLWLPVLLISYIGLRKAAAKTTGNVLLVGLVSGLLGGGLVLILLALGQVVNIRAVLINASPTLYGILSLGVPLPAGFIMPVLVGAVIGLVVAGVYLLPPRVRSAIIQGAIWVMGLGLVRDLAVTVITRWGFIYSLLSWAFAISGLSIIGAIVVFVLSTGLSYWQAGRPPRPKIVKPTPRQRTTRIVGLVIIGILILLLPQILGIFFSEILDNVGLYILMGLGLNIVVGFAGLLDLGYVAFYAIGAYTMGVLTSPELAAHPMTYWQALPIALVASTLAGVILGLPVLRMRGDYLAIVTLGFGEIVRLLALSDWLRPWLGGSQGIQGIPQPKIGSIVLGTQQQLYYLILAGILIAAFIAWRLKDSRLGRSWMALREDEDVAQAMGINIVMTKLSAFAVGAFFSGLSGTIFAAKLTSAYPHSFNFMVSINVLCLIIIGGMGSIPGVFIGSLAMVGAPELLREFSEYRLLAYGAVLVAMMLIRPEGLLPEARRRLELHEEEIPEEPPAVAETAGD
jgi:branched-chain amino acid transport system permease protein